jgi:hypothetical protein
MKTITSSSPAYQYLNTDIVYIKNGVFVEPFEDDDEIIDGEGCYAIPGLVDVHFHGCVGHDFCDGTPEAIKHKTLPISCIQYHPEAGPGPHDSKVFFDTFVNTIKEYKGNKN